MKPRPILFAVLGAGLILSGAIAAEISATRASVAPSVVGHVAVDTGMRAARHGRMTTNAQGRTAQNNLPECVSHGYACVLNGTACCDATDECGGKFPNTICQAK